MVTQIPSIGSWEKAKVGIHYKITRSGITYYISSVEVHGKTVRRGYMATVSGYPGKNFRAHIYTSGGIQDSPFAVKENWLVKTLSGAVRIVKIAHGKAMKIKSRSVRKK